MRTVDCIDAVFLADQIRHAQGSLPNNTTLTAVSDHNRKPLVKCNIRKNVFEDDIEGTGEEIGSLNSQVKVFRASSSTLGSETLMH